MSVLCRFFFQAEDGIRGADVTGVQTCALPIYLRDLGKTVIVVEHDEETIREADWVVDIGPGAGKHGGEVVAEGTPNQIEKNPKSVTGQYLSGKEFIEVPKRRRAGNGKKVSIIGAEE